MRISDSSLIEQLTALGVEHKPGVSLAERTSLKIGGTSDVLVVRRHDSLPEAIRLLKQAGVPHRILGGGTNVLLPDGEMPWVILQIARQDPEVVIAGNSVTVDCASDLGRTVTTCAKSDLGGIEGLIGVPGTVGGAVRMNAGAFGTPGIGAFVREVKVYRAAAGQIEILRASDINFEYRHTSFASDDIMLTVRLELPSKPYQEILQGIRISNTKRRASQPLNQRSAGCIFKNPPGLSAGRMIDELGLKGHAHGDARVSQEHANFFVNAGHATSADMLALIDDVRRRVRDRYGIELEEEVVVWKD